MKIPGLGLIRDFGGLRGFNAVPEEKRRIVFYAEDAASRVHFEPVLRELSGSMGRHVCYLTSDADDPILSEGHANVNAFAIGEGAARTALFGSLKSDVFVMTMPDLETFYLKRSPVHPVHYVYLFHSIVSTHMIYREAAFDHYDTVLVVGPHHVREIRATEKHYGLHAKNIVEHGYGRLDTLMGERAARGERPACPEGDKPRVLVAPSWGPQGLLETAGEELVDVLTSAGLHTTVRPHPMTTKKWPKVIDGIRRCFESNPNFLLETDIASQESLHRSHIMISDWSGAALEYAFAEERPVLFVDVERKVNNPGYRKIDIEPLEVTIRSEIGEIIEPRDLHEIPERIKSMCSEAASYRERILESRRKTVFNVGSSGRVAAEAIARIVDEAQAESE